MVVVMVMVVVMIVVVISVLEDAAIVPMFTLTKIKQVFYEIHSNILLTFD
jgi:hypothetical protein